MPLRLRNTLENHDVLLFVKGVNKQQGLNKPKKELNCVFRVAIGDDNYSSPDIVIRTNVTSSAQEVFRCQHPNLTALNLKGQLKVKVSLQMQHNMIVVPSVAYYNIPSQRKIEETSLKALICACTMVYNVSKFLKEWVMYYSSIGVERFILYDNGSDDGLEDTVKELNRQGYRVELVLWIWPKTQEAGFSHSVIYAKRTCSWVLYLDVDEFIYSPSWLNSTKYGHSSKEMLRSLLPIKDVNRVGQVSIKCYEFGPSNRTSHPIEGVTRGYNCRRKSDYRHKSIVLLEAVDYSLGNAIHHFKLKEGYKTVKLDLKDVVVNHYKYQAWEEFKAKFRRRVSAYVVDWMVSVNLMSQDRTPGLGFRPVEPEGWAQRFCEDRDDRLKVLMQRWFGSLTPTGLKMPWQT